MIRVLHCVNGMNRGGLETFIMNVYRNIDRSKIQFDFLVHTDKKCNYDDEIYSLGGEIFQIPSRNKGILKNQKSLEEFFNTHKGYRILHQHVSSLSYVDPLKTAKRHRIPVRIVHGHSTKEGGSFLHNFTHRWNKYRVKTYATHYFACSDLAGEWLYGNDNSLVGSIKIINNGIQTRDFSFNGEKRKKVRVNLGIEDKFVIGHVGRFTYAKNHEYLINLFNAYYQEDPNSVLLLVGDGELRGQIEQQIRDLHLENNVILTGVRDDIPDLLQAMDIFVFPSHYEGLPFSLVEAQASGLPCVASNNITKDVKITNNIIYMDISPSIANWVDKILEFKINFVRQDESQKIIRAGFDIEKVAAYLQNLYIKAIGF